MMDRVELSKAVLGGRVCWVSGGKRGRSQGRGGPWVFPRRVMDQEEIPRGRTTTK